MQPSSVLEGNFEGLWFLIGYISWSMPNFVTIHIFSKWIFLKFKELYDHTYVKWWKIILVWLISGRILWKFQQHVQGWLTFKAPRVIRCSLINWYMMVEQGSKMPLQVRVLYFHWVRDCIPNSVHHMCPGHLPIVPGNEPFRLKKLIQAVLCLDKSLTTQFSK